MIVTDGVGSRQLRQHLARPTAAEGVVLGTGGQSEPGNIYYQRRPNTSRALEWSCELHT
jgi:hypothetical protein